MTTINVQIKSTKLGIERGMMTYFLYLEWESSGQGFGGRCLDGNGCSFGIDSIRKVLEAVGVENWEDLPGKYIRIRGQSHDKILEIGHITKDRWYSPGDHAKAKM